MHTHENNGSKCLRGPFGASSCRLWCSDQWPSGSGHEESEGQERGRVGPFAKKCRVVAKEDAELYGLPRPRPFHLSPRDQRRNDAAIGAAYIHQCWGTRSNASNARV